jgi:Cof subfamily protein (haloacid dehalogenase superfamily)
MTSLALIVSDVDGTLVTPDKAVTAASCAAVRRLADAGIAFTVVSSRPPFGLKMLVEPLGLKLPMGAFNGGMRVQPDGTVIESHDLSAEVIAKSFRVLREFGTDIWVFTGDRWLIEHADNPYVLREQRTVQAVPESVVSLRADELSGVGKIVGVSGDFDRLAACEKALQATLGEDAVASRSQHYYLDVTPPNVSKGTFIQAMIADLGITPDQVATIGDMDNDVAMFRESGLSVAMGNASPAAAAAATISTLANTDEGFARAVDILLAQHGGA